MPDDTQPRRYFVDGMPETVEEPMALLRRSLTHHTDLARRASEEVTKATRAAQAAAEAFHAATEAAEKTREAIALMERAHQGSNL